MIIYIKMGNRVTVKDALWVCYNIKIIRNGGNGL